MEAQILQTLKEEKTSLLISIKDITDKVSAIDALIALYNSPSNKEERKPVLKEERKPLAKGKITADKAKELALQVIKETGYFIKASYIASKIWGEDVTQANKNVLSTYLGQLLAEGKIARHREGSGVLNITYGLPSWMIGDVRDEQYVK